MPWIAPVRLQYLWLTVLLLKMAGFEDRATAVSARDRFESCVFTLCPWTFCWTNIQDRQMSTTLSAFLFQKANVSCFIYLFPLEQLHSHLFPVILAFSRLFASFLGKDSVAVLMCCIVRMNEAHCSAFGRSE